MLPQPTGSGTRHSRSGVRWLTYEITQWHIARLTKSILAFKHSQSNKIGEQTLSFVLVVVLHSLTVTQSFSWYEPIRRRSQNAKKRNETKRNNNQTNTYSDERRKTKKKKKKKKKTEGPTHISSSFPSSTSFVRVKSQARQSKAGRKSFRVVCGLTVWQKYWLVVCQEETNDPHRRCLVSLSYRTPKPTTITPHTHTQTHSSSSTAQQSKLEQSNPTNLSLHETTETQSTTNKTVKYQKSHANVVHGIFFFWRWRRQ